MYLSRVSLNLASLEGIAFASSPYRIHAAVERACASDERETDEGRILWRLDETPDSTQKAWLYVLSPGRPDLAHVCDQAGCPGEPKWITKDYSPVLERVAEGQRWQFRLKANPVRKVSVDKGRRKRDGMVGTIQGHVTEAQQRTWLLERADARGFRIVQTEEGFERLVVSHRRRERFKRGEGLVTLTTAQFDGVLEVTDADAFRRALGFGIGRARGFGCGLMTVAPV